MTASPPPADPPLVRTLCEVREILERARRTGDRREIAQAIERINRELDGLGWRLQSLGLVRQAGPRAGGADGATVQSVDAFENE